MHTKFLPRDLYAVSENWRLCGWHKRSGGPGDCSSRTPPCAIDQASPDYLFVMDGLTDRLGLPYMPEAANQPRRLKVRMTVRTTRRRTANTFTEQARHCPGTNTGSHWQSMKPHVQDPVRGRALLVVTPLSHTFIASWDFAMYRVLAWGMRYTGKESRASICPGINTYAQGLGLVCMQCNVEGAYSASIHTGTRTENPQAQRFCLAQGFVSSAQVLSLCV